MPSVIKADTVLLISFSVEEGGEDDDRWLARPFPSSSAIKAWERGQPADLSGKFWQRASRRKAPTEAQELDLALRPLLGAEPEHADPDGRDSPWRVRRLEVSDAVLTVLQKLSLVRLGDPSGAPLSWAARLVHVEAWRFPARAGVLLLQYEWPHAPNAAADLTDFCDDLWHLRTARREDGSAKTTLWRSTLSPRMLHRHDYLGPLAVATTPPPETRGTVATTSERRARLVDLHTVATWLLGDEQTGVLGKPSSSAYARHHTSVVLDGPLDAPALQDALFRLGRAVDRRHVPPPRDEPGSDRTLVVRGNRVLRVCREGIASIGWLSVDDQSDWEFDHWPARFVAGRSSWGIYFALALAARAERDALGELTNEVARRAARPSTTAPTRADLDATMALLRRMATYTSTLCTEDSGGVSDYSLFHRTAREVLGTPSQLAELREELREMRDLVVTEYERHRAEDERLFQRNLGYAGIFGIGFGVVTGVLGVGKFADPALPWLPTTSVRFYAGVLALGLALGGLPVAALVVRAGWPSWRARLAALRPPRPAAPTPPIGVRVSARDDDDDDDHTGQVPPTRASAVQ